MFVNRDGAVSSHTHSLQILATEMLKDSNLFSESTC